MPVAPVRIFSYGGESYIDTYAVLDTAAEFSLCSKELVDLLNLSGKEVETTVIGATGTAERSLSLHVMLNVQGYLTSQKYPVEALALSQMTDLSDHIPTASDSNLYPHLRDIIIPDHARKKVDLLIGIGESHIHCVHKTQKGESGQLWASLTGLGWVVHGRDQSVLNESVREVRANATRHVVAESSSRAESDQELLSLVRRQLALDFDEPQHDTSLSMSRQESQMLKRQKDTVKLVGDKYEVALLWKKHPSVLSNNISVARKCLLSLGQRLLKDPVKLAQYKDFIDAMLEKFQAEGPMLSTPDEAWYLLHHAVGPKFRVVFNGAAVFAGQCLNSILDKGPEHSSTLLGTLFRWRLYRYAAQADIKSMFYNVSLPENERDYVRFLWFADGNPNNEIKEYRLAHQVPGLTSSPSNACFVLRQLAIDNPTKASQSTLTSIVENFYMDDWLPSFPSIEAGQKIIQEIRPLCDSVSFHLTKFAANHPDLLANVPSQDHAPPRIPSTPASPEFKALGIWWDTDSDMLKIKVQVPTQPETKRGVLAAVMSTFDPTGIALPFLLEVKLFLQDLFKMNVDWDHPIPEEKVKFWREWISELPQVESVKCPRPLIPQVDYEAVYLCTFVDASEKGYAAVCYIVCEFETHCSVSQVHAKMRVRPAKVNLTIPRLELMSAVLGAKIADSVRRELPITFSQLYFWTDSITVLHWVKNPNLRLKAFVANRVAKVIELTEEASWSHVRTQDNPADIGSRGLRPSDHHLIKPWIEGPSFLRSPKAMWPLSSGPEVIPAPKALELKANVVAESEAKARSKESCPEFINALFYRYSTLKRLKIVAGWWLRYRQVLLLKIKGVEVPLNLYQKELSAVELDEALLALVRACQWSEYPHLMQALKDAPVGTSGKTLPQPAKKQWQSLRQLNPFVDEKGFLRVGGRLHHAGLSYNQTYPLILPRRHPLTARIISDCHRTTKEHHIGFRHILAVMSERFWVIGTVSTVKHYLRNCVPCRHWKAPMGQQQMGPLPPFRFKVSHPPFSFTAVDYFGPMLVKVNRREIKRWGCLMTCLTTRAVFIDVAYFLTTSSFLKLFRRFINTHGAVKELLSDNATNFRSAEKELKEDFKQVKLDQIAKGLRNEGVDFHWHFNPPAASHQGGIFERIIGLAKSCLKRTMNHESYRTPDDEGLITMLKEVEGTLNSRPLIPCGDDPTAYDVLTPLKILHPGVGEACQSGRQFVRADALKDGYKAALWHAQEFWRRFSKEYIPLLQKRSVWCCPERNFEVGDLVLIQDDSLTKNMWKKAIVVYTYKNKADNLVRRVRLRLASGKLMYRDIRKIALLEGVIELKELEKRSVKTGQNEVPVVERRQTRSMTRNANLPSL